MDETPDEMRELAIKWAELATKISSARLRAAYEERSVDLMREAEILARELAALGSLEPRIFRR